MHNAAFKVLGIDAVYVSIPCAGEDLAPLMRALTRAGGGGNVTVPHKEAAAAAVAEPSERVRTLGVCNTFWAGEDGMRGDNTDVDGVLEALHALHAPPTAWLIAGTGGGARAVVAAAGEVGARVAVHSRNVARAERFQEWAASRGVSPAHPADCEVLINATPLGLQDSDPMPIALDSAPHATVALDLVYSAQATPWVRHLRAAGLQAADGRVMLVAQGMAALRRWFPRMCPPAEVMRAAVDGALR